MKPTRDPSAKYRVFTINDDGRTWYLQDVGDRFDYTREQDQAHVFVRGELVHTFRNQPDPSVLAGRVWGFERVRAT